MLKEKLAKLGVSVTLIIWLVVSFVSASASVVCVDYAKNLFKFKAPDFISLVQKASWVINIPPLFSVWKKYNVSPSWPSSSEFVLYTFLGIVGAFETYLKSKALILLPGSTYVIMFESDLVWNVLMSVLFLKRCYHPLQFVSPCLIVASTFIVAFSKDHDDSGKTGLGKFGGVLLALGATFLTATGQIFSDKFLKIMMKRVVNERAEEETMSGVVGEREKETSVTDELLNESRSKSWYPEMEQVKNVEFTLWSSAFTFFFLIIWTFVDPKKEYKTWPDKLHTMKYSTGHSWGDSHDMNVFIFVLLMVSLSFSRLFVRLSMNHILMVLSAFFFAVWKPFRRIGTTFISIILFHDTLDQYKGISIALDFLALISFGYGGYLYKLKKEKEKAENIY